MAVFRKVEEAHTNLNTFGVIVSILEGGHIYGGDRSARATAEKIIKLCKTEMQRQLVKYDDAKQGSAE